jgi:hypothetical protein
MGTGTPSQYPLPSDRNPGEKPWMVSPAMNQYVMPCNTHSMPYVAMNGGSRRSVIIIPLRIPTAAPQNRPTPTPRAIDPVAFIAVAARHADNPTFAPTDRSRPAVKMVSVKPDAIRNVRLACRSTLRRFEEVKNTSLVSVSAVPTTATAIRR